MQKTGMSYRATANTKGAVSSSIKDCTLHFEEVLERKDAFLPKIWTKIDENICFTRQAKGDA